MASLAFLSVYVTLHRHHLGFLSSSSDPTSAQHNAGSGLIALVAHMASGSANRRPVYPYSIIPGGIQDRSELREVIDHDPVAAESYAGFDYDRARIVEVGEPKLVYVAYRMKNKVYWTKKKISLHKGEKLITDGKITARTRCGNPVSEKPKAEISPEEPPAVVFEQPLGDGGGTAMQAPNNFESLLIHPGGGQFGPPAPGAGVYNPGIGEGVPPFAAPPLPIGACVPPGQEEQGKPPGKPPCPTKPTPPPSSVPEPGTIVLMSSGVAALYWKYRRSKSIA